MRTYPLRDVSRWIGKDPRTLRRWGFGAELTHAELFEACERVGFRPQRINDGAFCVGAIWFSLDHFSGASCINGTRVSTEAVMERFLGGERVSALAINYRIKPWRIEAAIRWEAKR